MSLFALFGQSRGVENKKSVPKQIHLIKKCTHKNVYNALQQIRSQAIFQLNSIK